ncbi:MAG: acyltransferase [Thiothrix sp.]|nr:MAG: acyltransferase [Thiothrix sp.]
MAQNLPLSHVIYRPDIDGLRAIAVLAVVVFHAFPNWLKGGFIGVDIFFIISGYLISMILFESLEKGTFEFYNFYSRRIRRIFPALILVLLFCFLFGWFALLADEFKQLGLHIAAGAGFFSNFLLWTEVNYFDNAADTKPLVHLWSLGIEEQFYIIWPLFVWIAWRKKFNFLLITVLFIIISFLLNVKISQQEPIAAFYLPQTRFWELLCGGLLAWFMLYIKKNYSHIRRIECKVFGSKRERLISLLVNIVAFSGLSFLVYGFLNINKELIFPGTWVLVPILGSILIIASGSRAWPNRVILSNRIFVWFGLISFPLYLWHWPLLSFARIIESEVPNYGVRIALVLFSIFLAWLTYKFIEFPIRSGKYKKSTFTMSFLMALAGFLGFSIYYHDGYEFRKSIIVYANNKNELLRTPAVDSECLKYIDNEKPLIPYCRFMNANSKETVAVIGDSHAHVAYPGMAFFLKKKKINTLLLANSGCPPFLGSPTGNNAKEKKDCTERVEQLINLVNKNKDIRKVFIFTRGAIYTTGFEPVNVNKKASIENIVSITEFYNSAQKSINALSQNGKLVFYVTENPELNYPAEACLARPLKRLVKNCSVDKSLVLDRQSSYLKAFNNLKNVTMINSLDAFCPESACIVFDDNGALLYADDDHLSVAGSFFQVDHLLKKFLE